MNEILFTKMVASGNDFIVIDTRNSGAIASGRSLSGLARKLCERKLSIGADGMLFLDVSNKADFRMRIFNPDGSEAEMCGNGARCAALYAVENKITGKDMRIETGAGIIDAEAVGLRVKIRLTEPKNIRLNRRIAIGKKRYTVHSLDTGVPHVVIFTDKLDKANVEGLGSKIRHSGIFKPAGTNVNFVNVSGQKEIKIRTYERGVEAETYACGTGSAASAIVSHLMHGLRPHIDVITRGGEILRVYFDIKYNKIKNVFIEGEARVVYKGGISYV